MNVILQSAPGVGRTYLAKRIAYSMMDVKDVESVKIVMATPSSVLAWETS